jgi:hypothetical protein
METFQNRGEGFDIGEGVAPSDEADQTAKLLNRCHMRRDVIDDEILNFSRWKERTARFIAAEPEQERNDRIRGFSVDDQMLLGDEEISNFCCVVFIISWKRIDRGFEFKRSGRFLKKRDKRIHFFFFFRFQRKIIFSGDTFLLFPGLEIFLFFFKKYQKSKILFPPIISLKKNFFSWRKTKENNFLNIIFLKI